MKKLAFFAATAMIGSALAETNWHGFYAGIHTGYSNIHSHSKDAGVKDYVGTRYAAAFPISGQTDIAKGRGTLGFYTGYNWMMGCVLFGGELRATWAKMHAFWKEANTQRAYSGVMEMKRNRSFSATGRIGYLLAPETAAYGRLGFNYGEWHYRFNLLNTTAPATNFWTGHKKDNFNGVCAIGLETAMNRSIMLRTEWSFEWSGKSKTMAPKIAGNGQRFGIFGQFRHVRSNCVMFGVAYKA